MYFRIVFLLMLHQLAERNAIKKTSSLIAKKIVNLKFHSISFVPALKIAVT